MTDFKRVFVDTAPIIYYLENSPLYSEVIKRFFYNVYRKEYTGCYFCNNSRRVSGISVFKW